ncbi:MAG: ABC transporter permease [Planctomycetes bacterium]|nr:ABC transporter permease [Planctomycetota bacterium]
MIHVVKIVQMALKSLMLHKFRSLLSVLGIIFGVMAVVAMMAVGEGAKRKSLRQIELLGTNNLIVRAVELTESEKRSAEEMQSLGLTLADVRTVAALPGASRVAAIREMLVEGSHGAIVGKPSVVGTTPDYAAITNIYPAEGRFIVEEDVHRRARVCVLGARAAHAGSRRAAVGDPIKLGADWFTVLGILEDKDYSGSEEAAITPRNSNNDIYIPISVIPAGATGDAQQADELWIQAEAASVVAEFSTVVNETLRRTHHGVADYEVLVPSELLRQKQRTIHIFNLVLVCIAGISLVVGGIGIMNIMLATVSERTREIGICRAVGACRSDIVIQFLAESIVLTVLGGLLGTTSGWVAARVIAASAGWATMVSWQSVVAAAIISGLVGIFFGLYPAIRAAQMDPLAALRLE